MSENNKGPDPLITKVETVPQLQLIITNSGGDVLGLIWGGPNPGLAMILSEMSAIDEVDVTRQENSLTPLGNDFYRISRDMLLSISGALTLGPIDFNKLQKQFPDGAIYTIVVSR